MIQPGRDTDKTNQSHFVDSVRVRRLDSLCVVMSDKLMNKILRNNGLMNGGTVNSTLKVCCLFSDHNVCSSFEIS